MTRVSSTVLFPLIYILSSIWFTQGQSPRPPSLVTNTANVSWPHDYPGMPSGGYNPEWQNYFEVTESLPNVTWQLPRNWAGNIPVQREDHPNNTLFFWAFEKSNGSFTCNSTDSWAIWLNGGPGSSSMVGLLFENGPLQVGLDYSLSKNNYSWNTISDHLWLDSPVGAGYSTVEIDGHVANEDQLVSDFFGFLENFVKVFPNLANRPLYIIGESYAGKYIPYIAKGYFERTSPPVKLRGIAIGDGDLGSPEATMYLPVITVLETYPQIIGYDTEVFEYFKEQTILCGFNLTLQYPQPEPFPNIDAPLGPGFNFTAGRSQKQSFMRYLRKKYTARKEREDLISSHERHRARNAWKRDLSGRANGTIDPWYSCDLFDEMLDYSVNFTFPWSPAGGFDVYDIPDALNPEVPQDASVFLNDARTRAAIHAPTSRNWSEFSDFGTVFAPTNETTDVWGDPSVAPMAFLTDLATNATKHGVKIVIYSGNDDSLIPHFSSQVAIQNMTFGGIQGFTRKPSTEWYNDAGQMAGIVHQERNVTYVLVNHAGHLVPYNQPDSALVLAREFIFGNNRTGLVINSTSGVSVVGGESDILEGEILRGESAIYYGSSSTVSSYFFPMPTVEAWNKYIATAAPSWVAGNG